MTPTIMTPSLEQLLGISPPDLGAVPAVAPVKSAASEATQQAPGRPRMRFSFLFFSDVCKYVDDASKYAFMREVTLFADCAGFEAVYLPERHFHEFGSIYANPAIMAAHLIPQTARIRFRTAGISLPLHHPAEVVEWWAMNDVLSNGRIDLGFGSGWSRQDFIYAPGNYADRRQICTDTIPVVQRLWRGDSVSFSGPGGTPVPVRDFRGPCRPS